MSGQIYFQCFGKFDCHRVRPQMSIHAFKTYHSERRPVADRLHFREPVKEGLLSFQHRPRFFYPPKVPVAIDVVITGHLESTRLQYHGRVESHGHMLRLFTPGLMHLQHTLDPMSVPQLKKSRICSTVLARRGHVWSVVRLLGCAFGRRGDVGKGLETSRS